MPTSSKSPAPTVLLLDGHSLAYRAFYALPTDLATKAGTVTNAVFGFTSMLVKLLSDEKPEYLAVAFDAPARTFRYDLDPEYKAGRKETPDLFAAQMPLIREVLETMQVRQLCVEGVALRGCLRHRRRASRKTFPRRAWERGQFCSGFQSVSSV